MNSSNLNVAGFEALPTPNDLGRQFPLSDAVATSVAKWRSELRACLRGEDERLVVITGPCSIHDEKMAIDYAKRLSTLSKKLNDKLFLIMRVYFEKPRTTVGWKGLISDPHLDDSSDIKEGLARARQILIKVSEIGLPCATEFLDPIVPQYTSDLVVWTAIGARTTESQTHRQMASGLSMPVGFKNATDGGLQIAIDAMASARHGHSFVGIDDNGMTSVVRTNGNQDVHIVLRGGGGKPNWSKAHIAYTKALLEKEDPKHRPIMVDCSHGNSNKDFTLQPNVCEAVIAQYMNGEPAILGVMLESNINAGNQKLSSDLKYGVSVTDGCIDWDTTEQLLTSIHAKLP